MAQRSERPGMTCGKAQTAFDIAIQENMEIGAICVLARTMAIDLPAVSNRMVDTALYTRLRRTQMMYTS